MSKPTGFPVNRAHPVSYSPDEAADIIDAGGRPTGPTYESVISELEVKLAAAEAEASGRWLRMDLVQWLLRAGCPADDATAAAAKLEAYVTGESR